MLFSFLFNWNYLHLKIELLQYVYATWKKML